jgi:hypothetical protein
MVADNGYITDADTFSGDWNDLINVPVDIDDGDADTLADISCSTTQVIKWNGASWACADDTVLDEADVDAFVSNNGFASASDIFSGAWSALTGVPSDLSDGDDDTLAGLTCGDQQVALWNASGGNWYCGDDKLLTASEVQAMVEAMTGLSLPADTTLDGDGLLTNASTLSVDMLDTAGAVDGDVLSFDGLNAGWSESGTGAGCVLESMDENSGYVSLNCGGIIFEAVLTPGVIAISAGSNHTCAIEKSGLVQCWGLNEYGQISSPAGTFFAISAGYTHTCGIDSSGTVQCWGQDNHGQSTPPGGIFSTITAGANHTCAIDSIGLVECWGQNSNGESSPPAGTFSAIAAGQAHICGIDSGEEVQCWGGNTEGQASSPAGTFSAIAAGDSHTCGLDSFGLVECWGHNYYNQSSAPAGIFSAITAYHDHNCAIKNSGFLYCWGRNDYGEASPPSHLQSP